jgi:TldD protein
VAAERALTMLTAKVSPSGTMPVILSSEAGGTFIHEACGHGLESDHIQRHSSVYTGKLGNRVASELITVLDDATLPGSYGSFRFDDEGTPGARKVLIEQGVLKMYMSDLISSKHLSIPPSGNGRRESFRNKPIPRMTNTFIDKGTTDPKLIIDSIPEGLLVKKMGGGEVNPTNGNFVFEVV